MVLKLHQVPPTSETFDDRWSDMIILMQMVTMLRD
jgi:hypothetical protein